MSKKEIKKITNDETYRVSMKRLADRPNSSSAQGRGGMSSAELKAYMDKYPELLKAKLDELIDLCNGASGENLLNLLHTSVTDDTTGEEKTLAEWIPEIVAYVEAIKGKDGIGHFAQVDLENEPTEDNDAVTLAYFRDHSQSADYVDKVIGEAKREIDESKFSKSGDTITTADKCKTTSITGDELKMRRYSYAEAWIPSTTLALSTDGDDAILDLNGQKLIGTNLNGGLYISSKGDMTVRTTDKLEIIARDGGISIDGPINAEYYSADFWGVTATNVTAKKGIDATTVTATDVNTTNVNATNVTAETVEVDKNTVLNGDVQAKANLTVGGNLEVKGTTFTVDSETLRVKDKIIEVGKDNTTTLIGYAGIAVPKYDGTNDGALVYDSTGTAYVGDARINSDGSISDVDMKPLVTRADTMTDGAYPVWDNATKSVKSGVIKSGSGTNAIVVGNTNQAISENAIAFGLSNIAGLKGYKWSEINHTNRTITLATAHTGGTAVNCEYTVGNIISIVNGRNYDQCSKITAVNGSVITVDTLPFSSVVTEAEESDNFVIWSINSPRVGTVELGRQAAVFGEHQYCAAQDSFAAGRGHHAGGKYSACLNRENQAGYASFAAGRWNAATGEESASVGGKTNYAIAPLSATLGGEHLKATGDMSACVGGESNSAEMDRSGVFAGKSNTVKQGSSVVLGGQNNTVNTAYCAITGGIGNTVTGYAAGIFAGSNNTIQYNANGAAIVGGANNLSQGNYSAVLGGQNNTCTSANTVALGGIGLLCYRGGATYCGVYNNPSTLASDALFVIGTGDSDTSRKNGLVFTKSGNLTLAGGLTLGKAPSNDMEAATKKYVDDKVSAIPTFKTMTQAQYDALSTKDANTLYLIVG